MHDEEHPRYRELESPTRVKTKNMRPTPTNNFEAIRFEDNPLRNLLIGSNLHVVVIKWLVNCLIANADLFFVSPDKIPGVYSKVARDHMKANLGAHYVS